jgi:GT2 family glycosyltransferase
VNTNEIKQFEHLSDDMLSMIETIYPLILTIKESKPFLSGPVTCKNIEFSINNIKRLMSSRSLKILNKIEYELIPLLNEFYYDFYFFVFIYGNKSMEKEHYLNEFIPMGVNPYIEQASLTGQYKYDVSIYVLAYNKLEYTKLCVESILKYTPSYINYELFFINNGSSDETQSYFDSLHCEKEIVLLHNSLSDIRAVRRMCEGRYILSISNDVVVTENYLENLITCIESDPLNAMVVPTTPNISNFQTIPCEYHTLEEMQEFAKKNNTSDSSRWEERTRLCNPLTLYRSDLLLSSKGVSPMDKYFVYGEFSDDALALRLRRAGYKMILAKDCFCHHFGSVTMKEAQVKENTLEKSRKLFIERYGVDAWGTGFCYDDRFIQTLTIKTTERVNILGINSGFGSNPLKIKTVHKEAGHNDVGLYHHTDDRRYVPDLKVYANEVIHSQDSILNIYNDISFDYILLESNVEQVLQRCGHLDIIKNKLSVGGLLAVQAVNEQEINLLVSLEPDLVIEGVSGHWYCWSNNI